ncbi:hypothetical protein ACGFX4_30480 [Kitasatospora sp. NPDC048365]|uniref:hypothetical protein n=1 Tax=Kitasatospora sp. NPDC048365 TaxID=3364050 RepID=UPI00371BE33A
MSIDLRFAGAGDPPVDPEFLVAVGVWLPYPDSGPHPALDGEPVAYLAAGLWPELRAVSGALDPVAARADPAGAACDLLRLLALSAVPDPGAVWGRRTAPVADLGRRPVLFRKVGGGRGPVIAQTGWPEAGAGE